MAVAAYYDRVNRDLLALIPPDARTVLEIGCGCGALAEAYRRINPGVRWRGVEKDAQAREIAVDRMTACFCGDIEDDIPISPVFDEGNADCLILGDILEHLRDPWEVLKSLADWLKPGGLALACIPNVQHWTILEGLLRGEWDYQDEGLLDRTHLRFFTLKSIREMFAGAGLEVLDIRGRRAVGDERGHDEFWGEWLDGADRHGPLWDQTRAYQYLVRALKPPAEVKPLHIHAVLGEGCCARPRIEEPLAMLATVPGVRTSVRPMLEKGIVTKDIPSATDSIVILQRCRQEAVSYLSEIEHLLDVCPRAILIAEWDDDPEAFPGLVASDFLPLRAVHAVQVSTEALAEVVRQYNPEVAVFPNMIAELPPPKEQRDSPIALFYGAQNREADWAPIMPALNRVLADHPRVTVRVVHDKAFYEALDVSNGNVKTWAPFQSYEEYRAILRSCDIALLPLEPTRFNRCKSDLKFLECAAEGVACLMSELAADQIDSCPRDAYRCWLNIDHFRQTLEWMIDDPSTRRTITKIAYAYVSKYRLLGQHYRKRHEWYLGLLSRRESLHQALVERVPELARSPLPAAETTSSRRPR